MDGLLNGKPQVASYRLPVVKVGSGAVVDVELRCESVVVVATHWLAGRTYLCADDSGECPGCMASTPRLAAYTLCKTIEKRGGRLAILEFSTASCVDFVNGCPKPLNGTLIRCTRPSSRSALRLQRVGRQTEMFGEAIDPFRLLQALATLFGVDQPRVGKTAFDWIESTQARRLHLLQSAVRRD